MALPSACAVPRRLVSMQRGACGVSRVLYRSLITGNSVRCATHKLTADPTRRTRVILNHLCRFSSHTKMSYTIEERGARNSMEYRVFFKSSNGTIVSPFHDIPLYANAEQTEFNMVVEIPRWTNAKMEISKGDKMNPIKQDTKKGKLRYVKNIFPHHGYIWNYGAFPQTWEDPSVTFQETDTKGDVDPLDVCEIGQKVHSRGSVVRVKVLGTMCLIDEGETDWKILAIDTSDPLAAELNDVADIDRLMPGFLKATYEWFKFYKVPDGKPVNNFAFEGKAKNKEYALGVVKEAYDQWKKLMAEPNECGIACENTCVGGSKFMIPSEDAQKIVEEAGADSCQQQALDTDPTVCLDKWYYPIQ